MIIVQAKAIPINIDAKDKIIGFAEDLIEKSRNEKGNIDYNLFLNIEDNSLLFVEKWESTEILNSHLQTEHFIEFGKNIDGLLKSDLDIQVFSPEEINL